MPIQLRSLIPPLEIEIMASVTSENQTQEYPKSLKCLPWVRQATVIRWIGLISLLISGLAFLALGPTSDTLLLFCGGILLLFIYYQVLAPAINLEVILFKDHLILRTKKTETKIDFSEIISIETSIRISFKTLLFPQSRGFKLILKNGTQHDLGGEIQGSKQILDSIHSYRTDLGASKQKNNIKPYDHVILFHTKDSSKFLLLDLLASNLYTFLIYKLQTPYYIIYFPLNYFQNTITLLFVGHGVVFLAGTLWYQSRINSKLRQGSLSQPNEEHDLATSSRRTIYKTAFVGGFGLAVLTFLLNLNIIDSAPSENNEWVDSRFNCVSDVGTSRCYFSLKQGDQIAFRSKGVKLVGTVIRTPGDSYPDEPLKTVETGSLIVDLKGRKEKPLVIDQRAVSGKIFTDLIPFLFPIN